MNEALKHLTRGYGAITADALRARNTNDSSDIVFKKIFSDERHDADDSTEIVNACTKNAAAFVRDILEQARRFENAADRVEALELMLTAFCESLEK